MEIIDLYDIHDAAFEQRPECNDCPSLKGDDNDLHCIELDDCEHENCPFVNAVIDEVFQMETSYYRTLIHEFIDKVMDLEMSEDENSKLLQTKAFASFVFANKGLFKPKLTEFFVDRLRDENNYRGVNVEIY